MLQTNNHKRYRTTKPTGKTQNHFNDPKYDSSTIDDAFKKVTQQTQKQLLHNDKRNKTGNRPTFSIPFNTNTTHINQILKKHWHLI